MDRSATHCHPAAGFSRVVEGCQEYPEERDTLWRQYAWFAAQCKLARANSPRNKEGNSLSRVPTTSPVSDIALRSPTAHQSSAGILTCFSVVPRDTASPTRFDPHRTGQIPGLPRFPLALRFRLTPKQLLLLRNPPPLRPSECCI